MAAAYVNKHGQAKITLATTLTRIVAGDGVRTIWCTAEDEVLLVYSTTLDDGGTLPATAHHRIPSGVSWPIEIPRGKRVLLAAAAGSVAATLSGVP